MDINFLTNVLPRYFNFYVVLLDRVWGIDLSKLNTVSKMLKIYLDLQKKKVKY